MALLVAVRRWWRCWYAVGGGGLALLVSSVGALNARKAGSAEPIIILIKVVGGNVVGSDSAHHASLPQHCYHIRYGQHFIELVVYEQDQCGLRL